MWYFLLWQRAASIPGHGPAREQAVPRSAGHARARLQVGAEKPAGAFPPACVGAQKKHPRKDEYKL